MQDNPVVHGCKSGSPRKARAARVPLQELDTRNRLDHLVVVRARYVKVAGSEDHRQEGQTEPGYSEDPHTPSMSAGE